MIINRILVVLILFCIGVISYVNVQAQPLQSAPIKDRVALSRWVQDNAHDNISHAKASSIVRYSHLYAFKNELDPLLVLSLLKVESGYRDKAVSSYGARGISQVVPRWHKDKIKGRSLSNTAVAIEVGTQVLKDCSDKWHGNVRSSLNCYSGGGGKKYYNKVMANKRAMHEGIFEARRPSSGLMYAAYHPARSR